MGRYWVDGQRWVEMEDAEGVGAVHLTVDDKPISVSGGQSILEAVARMPGLATIPALCYHPRVKPYGACRLCTVEVSEEGGRRFRFVAACLYDVKEDLIVRTNTKELRDLRRGIIELLLARSPEARLIQELAREYGVEKPRFTLRDQECILCGLCVRTCQEIIGQSAISLVNRGIYREVTAPFYVYELREGCVGCGECAYICPMGAIRMNKEGKPILPKTRLPVAEAKAMLKASGNGA